MRSLRSTVDVPGRHADGPSVYVISPRAGGQTEAQRKGDRPDGGAVKQRPFPQFILAALARREGWNATIIDQNWTPIPDELPDLAMISVWTATAPSAYGLAQWFRDRGVPVILGGVHASMMPGEALRFADSVVTGEAEAVMSTVLADAAAGRLEKIYHGVWGDMDAVPGIEEYQDLYTKGPWRRVPVHSIQTSRGCRFNCSFCSVIRINGRGMRHMDPARVVEEVRFLGSLSPRLPGGTPVYLLDDDLMSDRDYSAAMFEGLIRAGLKVPLVLQVSSGFGHDKEMISLASRAGCVSAFMGFESLSRDALREANKKNRPGLYKEIVGNLHQQGIGASIGIIFGFDCDRPGVFAETVDLLEEMDADFVRFTALTPMPGTETFAKYYEDGRIIDFDWGKYDGMTTVIQPEHFSPQELQDGLVFAYRRWNSVRNRSQRFVRQLTKVSWRVAGAFAFSERRYAAGLKQVVGRPRTTFRPTDEDLTTLLEVSRAPAQEAITLAIRSVSATG